MPGCNFIKLLSYPRIEQKIVTLGSNKEKMTSLDKIMTLHPKGKNGVNIDKNKYDIIRAFIIKTIQEHKEISYSALNDLAVTKLTNSFEGKVVWYIVTVKLDLEARGIIERIPKTSPHRLQMKN
ncbi:DUF6958 family protein [Aquimarina pacifica]|uniref:DUF6958 family protein n=1 Tax=Aquimarina pacifica TaxID=1296415 RepID=UPI00046E849E|nr:hypothetical protein [Aquimarina pacifica]